MAEVRRTEAYWRDWADDLGYHGPHGDVVRRSLITLKGLTYAPSGGIVAAATTSLPETFGGVRNWDYRYCWLRDATLTLLALDNFGRSGEAEAWRRWLLRAVAGDPADLQIMYGLSGERHLVEWELDWLPGYRGAKPVRVGNAAYRQLQLDVYGEVMDALHLARERGIAESAESWAMQRGMVKHLQKIWQLPDKGLWEVRGPDRHFTHSRVMVWVAFDRAVRAVEQNDLPGPVDEWRELRDLVHEEVLAKGWNADLGSFTQFYGGTELDAATLLIPAVGFLPGDDPRVLGTIEAIRRSLKHGDLVDRYDTDPGQSEVDGLTGEEGSFLACSFWFVDALALSGQRDEAIAMFDRLVGLVNDVGLLAEEYDARTGRMSGNFPQAFSHLALVNSAAVLYGQGHTREERDRRNGGDR
jgi:glucoamylase